MPFGRVEPRAFGDVFTAVVQKALVQVAFRRREDDGAIRHLRVRAQDLRYFFLEWDGAFFPIFRQEPILGFGPDVDAPMRQIQVRPVERLEFAAPKACCEH